MMKFLADGNSDGSRRLDEVGTAPAENEQLLARRPRSSRILAEYLWCI